MSMPLGSLVLVIASGSLKSITLLCNIVVVITHNLVACMRQFWVNESKQQTRVLAQT